VTTAPRALGLAIATGVAACAGPSAPADELAPDLIYTNGTVLTLDGDNTVVSSIAVKDDRIVALGDWTERELGALAGAQTVVYDLDGRTVIPGLQDSHLHFIGLGADDYYVTRFDDATSVAEIQEQLRAHLARLDGEGALDVWTYPGTGEVGPWLFGAGWNQAKLDEGRMASRHELDEVSRDVPITLDRVYLGVAVNTKVFELQGYDFERPETWPEWFTRDPAYFGPGDVIERDPETGLPTGVFYGFAPALIGRAPARTFEQNVESVAMGSRTVLSKGIVAIVDPGIQEENRIYQEAYNRGLLPIRVTTYDGIWRNESPDEMAARFRTFGLNNLGDDHYRIRGVKVYADGGAGSRSAAVSVPFEPSDADPLGGSNYGALVEPDFERRLELFRTAAVEFGWELHTHSIGDVAMRQTTDGYMRVIDEIREQDPNADLRYSIIHAYMADEPETSVIRDMAEYGIIASINPGDVHVEGDSFLGNLGESRMTRLLPFRTYLDGGVIMASGSDYFVAPWDPWIGIYAMRTRQLQISGVVAGEDQTIPLQDALKTYTINGAYLTYDDDVRGSLEVGKLADLVVLDADLLSASDEALLSMGDSVLLTMVGGSVEYRKEGAELRRLSR
jgi:predicted amidohydrolase YtcJ